MKNLAALKKEI